MDIDAFRLNTPLPATVGSVTGRRRKGPTTDPFLAGPVPMWWLVRAYRLGAAPLAVGLALWHARGLRRGQPGGIKVNAATRRRMGLSKDQARRGVHALHGDRLVTIPVGGRGRCMEVEINTNPKEPSVPTGSPALGRAITETTGAPAEAR